MEKDLNNSKYNLLDEKGVEMNQKELSKSIILYLIKNLGEKVEGRKKIMKLMFLINYFNISKQNLVKKSLLGNDFIIYHYGVFSFKIMEEIIELINEGKIKDSFPTGLTSSVEIILPKELEDRVNRIIEIFGNKTGKDLEVETLNLLKLNMENKNKFFGDPVSKLISD